MSNKAAVYELVFVMPDGSAVHRSCLGARRTMHIMIGYPPTKAIYGMRYYPSLKVWRVFDLRRVNRYSATLITPRHVAEFPERDAAIMWAVLNV